jgi:hypothetical protein
MRLKKLGIEKMVKKENHARRSDGFDTDSLEASGQNQQCSRVA